MELITKAQTEQLLANGRAQRAAIDQDAGAVDFVKLFTPDAQCTWLLTELDADGLAFGLCDLGMGEPELGYISLFELRTVRGKLGLPVERDLLFFVCPAHSRIPAFGRQRRVRGATPTRLPDSVRCDFLSQPAARLPRRRDIRPSHNLLGGYADEPRGDVPL